MKARIRVTDGGMASVEPMATDSEHDGPLGAMRVPLGAGVSAWIDPMRPGEIARIEAAALETDRGEVLGELLGPDAAATTGSAADSAVWGDTFDTAVVELDDSSLAWRTVSRLGFLLWLEQYAIFPLDQRDLDIEIAVLASRAGGLGLHDLADDRFARSLDHLVARVERAADSAPTASDALLREGLAAVVRTAGFDLGSHELADLARLLETTGERGHPVPLQVPADWVAVHADRVEQLAFVASAGAERRFSVDTRRVPGIYLENEESTASATWDAERSVLRVAVVAGPETTRSGPAGSLMFTVLHGDANQAVVAGTLTYSAATHRYEGTCRLLQPLGDADHVEIASSHATITPATPLQRLQLVGVREAGRGFQAERLPAPSGEFDVDTLRHSSAIDRWRRAATRFELAARAAEPGQRAGDLHRATVSAQRGELLTAVAQGGSPEAWRASPPPLTLAELTHFLPAAG